MLDDIEDEIITRPDGSTIAFSKLSPRDQLAHGLVRKFVAEAERLNDELANLKKRVFSEAGAHREMMHEDYGVNVGGQEGNMTLWSADRRSLIRVSVQKWTTFGTELGAAKQLIYECLDDWSSEGRPEIREIVEKVFSINAQGRVDTYGILSLREHKFEDERWVRAMQAIDDAKIAGGSRTYVRFYRVDEEGNEWPISLDIAKVGVSHA